MTTRIESYRFEDEFLKKVLESDVWKRLSASEDLNWSESLIDKYADQWNWKDLSENVTIPWTEDLIEKYKHLIHWKNLTWSIFVPYPINRSKNAGIMGKSNEEVSLLLRKFSDYWDWKEISSHAELNFTPELIQAFANKWIWKELIDTDFYYFRNLIRECFVNEFQISVWKTSFGSV
jgi:hypothetical protein